jgi:hypothetical protein
MHLTLLQLCCIPGPHSLASYVPFIYPLPIWSYWPLLILPLCAGVSIVYKAVKCQSMKTVPREALVIFVWILIGMVAAAGALAGVVKLIVEQPR